MNSEPIPEGMIFRSSRLLGEGTSIVHGVTGRRFGNMSLRSRMGSEPIASVRGRRKTLESWLGRGVIGMVFMNQIHGDAVAVVGAQDSGSGVRDYATSVPGTDAVITREPGLALAVETADCVPILLHDPATGSIGAIHAGWRGTALRIAETAVKAMRREFGSHPAAIRAFLGPSIGPCCYEVGEEVMDRFASLGCEGIDFSRRQLDLRAINRTQLSVSGLKDENVEVADICTSCRHDLFFSYRRDCGKTGGFVSAIMIGNP